MVRVRGFRPIEVPPLLRGETPPDAVARQGGAPALGSPFALNPAGAFHRQVRLWQVPAIPSGVPSARDVVHAILSRSEVLDGANPAKAAEWIAGLIDEYAAFGLPPPWARR